MGTSLWFAGNAAAPELEALLGQSGLVPMITSAVQLGFIVALFFMRYSSCRIAIPLPKSFFGVHSLLGR